MDAKERQDRLLEVAAAILEAAPSHELKMVLPNKTLFYTDLWALREFGETITQSAYVALDAGPVVASYPTRLVAALEKAGMATQDRGSDGLAKPVRLKNAPLRYMYVTPVVRELIERVAGWLGGQSSAAASAYSHGNPGWRHAHQTGAGAGSSPKSIDMLIALQQLTEGDPWMNQPLTRAESDTVARMNKDAGEVW